MPTSVYIETSIISYLVARPSRDARMAERQRQTREWWANRRHEYTLVTSEIVIEEAGRGDPVMAGKRIAALVGARVVDVQPGLQPWPTLWLHAGPCRRGRQPTRCTSPWPRSGRSITS